MDRRGLTRVRRKQEATNRLGIEQEYPRLKTRCGGLFRGAVVGQDEQVVDWMP